MDKEIVYSKIIDYLKNNDKASIGEIYIRFHMMNKGNLYYNSDGAEITASDIVFYIDEMYKAGIVDYEIIDGRKHYYILL